MIFDSSGWATVASSTSADAPGYIAVTWTWGGTISGSCATGIRVSAKRPPRAMTIAITIARRGRSMKTEETMFSAPAHDGRDGRRGHRRVGSRLLDPIHDDLLSFRQAVGNAGLFRSHFAEAHAALAGNILIIHHIHIAALLVGEDRGARHGDHLFRLDGLQEDRDELVCDQLAKVDTARRLRCQDRISNEAPDSDRIGVLRDRVVDEVHFPDLVIESAVRKAQ